MARTLGSKNRTKIPKASHQVRYAAQTMSELLEFYDEIISSKDESITLKNKMDAGKEVRAFLEMAGYADEIKTGLIEALIEDGRRLVTEDSDDKVLEQSTTKAKAEENTGFLGTFTH